MTKQIHYERTIEERHYTYTTETFHEHEKDKKYTHYKFISLTVSFTAEDGKKNTKIYTPGKSLGEGVFGKVFTLLVDGKPSDIVGKIYTFTEDAYKTVASNAYEHMCEVYPQLVSGSETGDKRLAFFTGLKDLQPAFLVMPNLGNITLAKYRPVDGDELIKLFFAAAKTLKKDLHSKGLCHGDIKEQNIVLNKALRNLAFVDYDLSKKEGKLSDVRWASYFPPEADLDKPVTYEQDIFSLGVMLDRVTQINSKIELSNKATYHLSKLCSDMTHYDPNKRPKLDEVISRLEQIQNNTLPLPWSTSAFTFNQLPPNNTSLPIVKALLDELYKLAKEGYALPNIIRNNIVYDPKDKRIYFKNLFQVKANTVPTKGAPILGTNPLANKGQLTLLLNHLQQEGIDLDKSIISKLEAIKKALDTKYEIERPSAVTGPANAGYFQPAPREISYADAARRGAKRGLVAS
jgi:serine/threonine protein kinase